ncbi:MAG: hypothetical protein ACJ8H8_29190 [Geminicoccaceae bacterium]
MAKIATTKSDKAAAEAAKVATHPRAADVTHDLADKAQGTTLRLIAKAAATAEDRARTSSPATAKPSVVLPTQAAAAFEMLKAGATVAGFWLQQGNDQLAHHAQTLRKLAAARNWRERLEIQSSFLRDSLARLNQGAVRYVDVTGALVAGSREARAGALAAASNAEQPR